MYCAANRRVVAVVGAYRCGWSLKCGRTCSVAIPIISLVRNRDSCAAGIDESPRTWADPSRHVSSTQPWSRTFRVGSWAEVPRTCACRWPGTCGWRSPLPVRWSAPPAVGGYRTWVSPTGWLRTTRRRFSTCTCPARTKRTVTVL